MLNLNAYLIRKRTRYAKHINADKRYFRLAIVEHQGSRVKIVVYALRYSFARIKACERTAGIRRDDFRSEPRE